MGQCNFQKGKGYPTLILILLLLLSPLRVSAEEGELGMYLEPAHFAPDIFHQVKGAKKTVLVPARHTRYGVDTFTEKEWKEEGMDLPTVQQQALHLASKLNETAEVEWVRDDRKVVEYAIINSDHPFISSIIFPQKDGKNEFVQRFRKILGDEVLVVIPERYTIYVFPRYGPTLQEFGPSLAEIYRVSDLKGSLEIFLVQENTCEVVGEIAY